MTHCIIFEQGALLKPVPEQSSSLPEGSCQSVVGKVEIPINYGPYLIPLVWGSKGDDHMMVQIAPNNDGVKEGIWFFHRSAKFEESGTEDGNSPVENEPKPNKPRVPLIDRGKLLKIPGHPRVRAKDKITPHFSWHEATRGDRIPESAAIANRIIGFAKDLEAVRSVIHHEFKVKAPMRINSWYRPPAVNKYVGGASKSRHLSGDAVDFYVPGISMQNIYYVLDGYWGSRGGLALKARNGKGIFLHIDGRGWHARWQY